MCLSSVLIVVGIFGCFAIFFAVCIDRMWSAYKSGRGVVDHVLPAALLFFILVGSLGLVIEFLPKLAALCGA